MAGYLPARVAGPQRSRVLRVPVAPVRPNRRQLLVEGALVLVATVPYNQFTVPAEAQTGADGYAQLELRRLDGFPAAQQQQLLVMMVRARKSGENVLSGISTRRLVSFPVDLRR
jgi:hypothetical protein